MTRLHEMLDDLAQEAKLYDVTERALTASRRRHRRRIIAATGTATAVTVIVLIGLSLARPEPQAATGEQPWPSASAGAPRLPSACEQHRLPMPEGYEHGYVTGADPTGRHVVGNTGDGNMVLIWRDGRLHATLSLGRQAILNDMNTSGTAVGFRIHPSGDRTQAFVYREGQLIPLKGERTIAVAVNDQGVIVGTAERRPVMWANADAEPHPLPTRPGTDFGQAGDIDEDGTAIGTLSTDKPYIWAPGSPMRELPGAEAISSIRNGWIAGISADGKPTRWNLRTDAVQRLSGDIGGILRVNASGWVAGGTTDGRLRLADTEGFVELPGGGRAILISDDGLVVAGITGVDGSPVPVVWRCAR